MRSPLNKIKKLIKILPSKDAELASKFLNKRDFQSILELVRSDIYKADKSAEDDIPDEYQSGLIELEGELITYISFIDPPEEDDYNLY